MNKLKVAHEGETRNEPTTQAPDSGSVLKCRPRTPELVVDELDRWFRQLRDQVASLYLCLQDIISEGKVTLGTEDVARAAMIEAIRCTMEFDCVLNDVRSVTQRVVAS